VGRERGETKTEAQNGNARQDNNAKLLSGLFTRVSSRTCEAQWAKRHGRVSCALLFNFLTQNGFRVEVDAQLSREKGERVNSRLSACPSGTREGNIPPLTCFLLPGVRVKTNRRKQA